MADMSPNSQASYLLGEIAARLSRLDSSVAWYRRRHFIWQMSTVLLSALVTVLAGLKIDVLRREDLILVVSAITTVVSAWGAFFAPRELWHLNAQTYGQLRNLETRIEFMLRAPDLGTKESEVLATAFQDYQQIMAEHNERWTQARQKSP